MKKIFFVVIIFLVGSCFFAEEFKGVYDIKFGQSPSEVKKNIGKNGFVEKDYSFLSSNSGNKEIVFTKKQTSFNGVECKILTVIAVFDKNEKMNEICVFCENYSFNDDELFEQINKSLDLLTKKYNFTLSSEEDYNTEEMFIKEYVDDKSTTFKICNNQGLILYDFKCKDSSNNSNANVQSEEIDWMPITSWEYLGEDSKFSYLLDLYEDFEDAKIDEKKLSNKKKSNYQITKFLLNVECTVAKLKIVSKDTLDSIEIILFVNNGVLYEGSL